MDRPQSKGIRDADHKIKSPSDCVAVNWWAWPWGIFARFHVELLPQEGSHSDRALLRYSQVRGLLKTVFSKSARDFLSS